MSQKKWKYHTENIGGNLHNAVSWINEFHPEWDIVTMDYARGVDTTIVVHRTPVNSELKITDTTKTNK